MSKNAIALSKTLDKLGSEEYCKIMDNIHQKYESVVVQAILCVLYRTSIVTGLKFKVNYILPSNDTIVLNVRECRNLKHPVYVKFTTPEDDYLTTVAINEYSFGNKLSWLAEEQLLQLEFLLNEMYDISNFQTILKNINTIEKLLKYYYNVVEKAEEKLKEETKEILNEYVEVIPILVEEEKTYADFDEGNEDEEIVLLTNEELHSWCNNYPQEKKNRSTTLPITKTTITMCDICFKNSDECLGHNIANTNEERAISQMFLEAEVISNVLEV